MQRLKTILLASLVALLSACAYGGSSSARLVCPPPLEFPGTHKLTGEQDLHLFEENNEAYNVFGKREDLMQERINTLCSIIESTHE